ncbi:bifunctional 4-hydroxy-2-oxoglutarate aldolase/2-dehydro-3-deoxy-phosphogluconate aldolase [Vicingaceae bacterium]|jgi:2-dehydro-3-deoxyphosphogluconate aldolase / (4S)-4-hydroxy-2-oxoglutarate aldolase|nr:bifunctional 4-hydroxy-2-oxoglutarate aldolase/2-dehydro-3-deoxy-phosphogluconate aldolase [Vicingaceae bacterium]
MDNQNKIGTILSSSSVIPVVSFDKGDNPVEFVNFLIKQGINCIEVTLRNDFAIEAIRLIKKSLPENFYLGVGTVVNASQVDELKKIGVDFMVSPGSNLELIKIMQQSGIAFLPGVSTPSEIIGAIQLGLTYLKFFPANLFGGINALKTYSSVFPNIIFCPTGGISQMNYIEFLDLPNVISVGGTWIQKKYYKKN